MSRLMTALFAAALVATAQLWLPLPDELLWVAFGYCIVSLLAIRSTPTIQSSVSLLFVVAWLRLQSASFCTTHLFITTETLS